MKKVALSFLALLAAGSMAFAADLAVSSPLTAKVKAEGSTTFTYKFSDGTWGVANAASASFYLNLFGDIDADTKAAVGSTSKPGQISANFRLAVKSDGVIYKDAALDYAKIVIGDLYIKIADATDPSIGYSDATALTYYDGTQWSGELIRLPYGSTIGNQASKAGYEIGYTIPKIAQLTFQVGLDSAVLAASHDFDYSAKVGLLAVDKLTLEGSYVGGTKNAQNGIAGKLGYDLGVLAFWLAYNQDLSTGGTSTAILNVDAPIIDGLKVSAAVSPLNTFDAIAKVSVGEKLLSIATFDVAYQVASKGLYADLELTKLVDGVTGWVKIDLNAGTTFYYDAGASFTKLVDGVTFSAEVDGKASTFALKADISL